MFDLNAVSVRLNVIESVEKHQLTSFRSVLHTLNEINYSTIKLRSKSKRTFHGCNILQTQINN